ncbi:MAG TPA: UDP-N-acetylmuramate dehydrogenase [Syntrophomonadaceae bacterium]|nr:UDP-N-acetylmuramate dehydrogenase [Syntrophomonadaceae bacterium]
MYSALLSELPPDIILKDEEMKRHTTFRIGGPADIMIMPQTIEDIQKAVEICCQNEIPYYIIGQGSNLLVMDKGIRGVVIKLGKNFKKVDINQNMIQAEAGIRLSELSKLAARHSLSGLEFAEGIPGSLGGAVTMNAGAYNGEIKNVVFSVEALSEKGEILHFNSDECKFSYRHSIFQENGCTVLRCQLQLTPGKQDEIRQTMREFARRRKERQPIEYPSAGSVFKRPDGLYVGPMIEKMGLKGYRIGGAEISAKHAGFIVNRGNATARDVLDLITHIQNTARERFNVELQPEIRIIGEQ